MHPDQKPYQNAVLILFTLFCIAFMPGLPGFGSDMSCWLKWAKDAQRLGIADAYESGANYPPVYVIILWLFGKLATTPEAIDHYMGYLRLVTLAADYWALWIVYKWIGKKVSYHLVFLCAMLNIAYSYNTMLWDQVDAILAAFVIASLYAVYHGKPGQSAVFMVLALNMKLQAIIFLPMWGLMLISGVREREGRKGLLMAAIAAIVTQGLLVVPFISGKHGAAVVWKVFTDLPDTFTRISMNAFNMWYWIVPEPFAESPLDDFRTSIGLDYHQIGLISFSIALLITLWPLLSHTVRTLLGRKLAPLSRETIWLTAALTVLVFFFFNTRMHERYSQPAFIFLTAYAFYRGKFALYALFSIAVLLNMEAVFMWFRLPNYGTVIFDPKFVAALFGICIIWAGALLYRSARKQAVSTTTDRVESGRDDHAAPVLETS
jgi:Gpi18-like mannosyltransferase